MRHSSALGAKTARACDSCLRKRARWFCAADDAFLCHACDNLVHSASQLASRHERVRLQTASSKVNYSVTPDNNKKVTTIQAWHSGFTRKARTSRHNKHFLVQQRLRDKEEEDQEVIFINNNSVLPLVPELGSEELLLHDEPEDQMLCRVPVFDPFDSELCSVYNEVKDERLDTNMKNNDVGAHDEEAFDLDNFSELLPSDVDLAEFAADVESLLDEDSGDVKGPELLDCKEEDEIDAFVGAKGAAMFKVKDKELDNDMACNLDSTLDMNSEALDRNIDSESLAAAAHDQKEEKVQVVASGSASGKVGTKKKRLLRLNYEDVIAAWASQGSPWTTGNRPKFNCDDCWPHFLGSSGAEVQCSYGEVRSLRGHQIGSADGGREARVSRYREKRRTRLFAKKIRYEVRKLNAEKRPRMKGRFVKRSSFVGATAFPAQLPLTSK